MVGGWASPLASSARSALLLLPSLLLHLLAGLDQLGLQVLERLLQRPVLLLRRRRLLRRPGQPPVRHLELLRGKFKYEIGSAVIIGYCDQTSI